MPEIEMQKAPRNQWWQWLLVPVASIFGSFIGVYAFAFLVKISLKLAGFASDSFLQTEVRPLFIAALFGWLIVTIAYGMAPTHKYLTARVTVGAVLVIYMGNVLLIASLAEDSLMQAVLGAVAVTLGALSALRSSKELKANQLG